jgi:hypothetical protein
VPRPVVPRRAAGLAAVTVITAGAGLLAPANPANAATPAAAGDAHPAEPATLLAQGSTGPAVAEIQQALHVPARGHFDRATRRAVVRFQSRHRLLVDGIVGVQTWDELFHIPLPRSGALAAGPAASATPASATPASATAASASGTGGYTIPSGIVQCESGGNYSAVNSSSGAGGAYQILPSTWRAYGGQGLPENAPPAEQDRIASEIYARQGAAAWTC